MNTFVKIIAVFTLFLSFASETDAGVEIVALREAVCGKDRICTPRNIFVLSIAVDRFEHAVDIPSQAYAVADAVSIARQFPASFSGVSTGRVDGRTLTDGKVTREMIKAEFEAIARDIDVNDLFVFSYAGTGWQQTFDERKGPEFSFPLANTRGLSDKANFMGVSELRS